MVKSIFQSNENNKAINFKKNESLNELLAELIFILKPIQIEKQKQLTKNKWPICFIVGNARSGSTLFLQWLASLGQFSYPTNILNRFAYSPYIGALVQELLFNPKYDFHNEFSDLNSNINFRSDLGKSKGALASNEFQHFFRNYMPNFDPEYLDDHTIKKVDFLGIKKGLASIENAFGKPFVTKAVMLQYNINQLYSNIPNSIFIYIKRIPIFNMQSLLFAREKYYNNRNIWWSVKPKEYEFLKEMDVFHQIAGQVYYTDKAIEEACEGMPEENMLSVKYEEFCKNPKAIYDELVEKYKINGYIIKKPYAGVRSFKASESIKLSKDEKIKFKMAYEYFTNTEV